MELTIAQVAEAVGRNESYVRQHVYRNHLAVRKEGRNVFVPLDEAARWARDRGLSFVSPARVPLMTTALRGRSARMTILTCRAPGAQPNNLFTLFRHRRTDALGPWASEPDETWSSIDFGDGLQLFSFSGLFEQCRPLFEQILDSGTLMVDGLEIRYALEPHPRRHWAYRDRRPLTDASVTSPFSRHSAEITEFWSFAEAPRRRWLEVLESLHRKPPPQFARLGFPLDRRPDRVGNLMIAGAADAITCELAAMRDQTLRFYACGDDLLHGDYRATVWASHSGDEVVRKEVAVIPQGHAVIATTSDVDHIGFAVHRTADGQCVDMMEAFLVMEANISMTLSGPAVHLRKRRRRSGHEVGPWDVRSTVNIRADQDSAELEKGIRRQWLDRRIYEREAVASGEGNLVRFGPDEFDQAAQYFLGLLQQLTDPRAPIYLADRYFMTPLDRSETDKRQRLERFCLNMFAATSGRPLRILCTQKDDGLSPWWASYPQYLTGHVGVRAFRLIDGTPEGRPGFHDRYLVTHDREILITHSLNGWDVDGVTFVRLPHDIYRGEAERLWNLDANSETANLHVREIC